MHAAAWLPFLVEIADRADEIALHFFRAPRLRVETKPDASPVTEADRAIEETARGLCAARRPALAVAGEEFGVAPVDGGPRLIIDPIDGTRNFVRGVPVFGTLLAVEEAGEIVAGLVSAPALAARWSAARGSGAFAGARRIRVSAVARLADAFLLHSSVGGHSETGPPAGFAELAGRVDRTRGFGDFYQHLLVAEGAAEIAIDPSVRLWDVAALLVIVEEAGGRATTLAGDRAPGGSFVTSNGLLHDAALEVLSGTTRHG
jgi:histidinol-phosphatase